MLALPMCPRRTNTLTKSFRLRSNTIPFFFQAEDGIRDGHVTGVQTCALPILLARIRVLLRNSSLIKDQIGSQLSIGDLQVDKIGRASCRERVQISVGTGSVKKKNRQAEKDNNSKTETSRRNQQSQDDREYCRV